MFRKFPFFLDSKSPKQLFINLAVKSVEEIFWIGPDKNNEKIKIKGEVRMISNVLQKL